MTAVKPVCPRFILESMLAEHQSSTSARLLGTSESKSVLSVILVGLKAIFVAGPSKVASFSMYEGR